MLSLGEHLQFATSHLENPSVLLTMISDYAKTLGPGYTD